MRAAHFTCRFLHMCKDKQGTSPPCKCSHNGVLGDASARRTLRNRQDAPGDVFRPVVPKKKRTRIRLCLGHETVRLRFPMETNRLK